MAKKLTKKKVDSFIDDVHEDYDLELNDDMDNSLLGDYPKTADPPIYDSFDDKDNEFGNSNTISANSYVEYKINLYIVDNYVKKLRTDILVLKEKYAVQFEYDYDKFSEIYLEGEEVFIYKSMIHLLTKDNNSMSLHIEGKYSDALYTKLMKQIRTKNPLRNKQVFVTTTNGRLDYRLKKPVNIPLNDVIMKQSMKEDIYDNTIYHMEHIDGCNGIILHGAPGTGKSITCSAVINTAIEKGYSCCYVTSNVIFDELEDFLNKMLAPCFLIFEDIDSMGQDRRETINTSISPLLQLISGLADKPEKIVYIATTNYIDHLDEALKNRPVRFNRNFFFDYPINDEIDKLIDLYFAEKITPDNKQLCYGLDFTGSHIKELKRTCDIKVSKMKLTYNEVFAECVGIIKNNFFTSSFKMGFNK